MSGGNTFRDLQLAAGAGRRAFTLIELLVVTSLITMLLALLVPAVRKAVRQAQAAACQVRLHHWGLIFDLCLRDNDGRFPYRPSGETPPVWLEAMERYFPGAPEMLVCPGATRVPGEDNYVSDAFTAGNWSASRTRPRYISYGINAHLGIRGARFIAPPWPEGIWQTFEVKGKDNIPVLFDCAGVAAYFYDTRCGPPVYDGRIADNPLSEVCINRHGGATNVLFLDWSVRRVGLKELWTLKWSPEFDTAGPWTKRGGALPEDWPKWMRKFKDY